MRLIAVAALFVFACSQVADEPSCPAGVPGTVTPFAEVQGSEGIAISPSGRMFVSSGSRILELSATGEVQEFALVPRAVGLAWWQDALYVAAGDDGSDSPGGFCSPERKGAVWKVTESGEASVFAHVTEPNFLAPTPWGTLLVSNDCQTNSNIVEVTKDGAVSVWNSDVPSANGLVFNLDGSALFTVSTFTKPAHAWRIPVTDGRSGKAESIGDLEGGAPDGVALDADGNLYVARNTAGKIQVRSGDDGGFELYADGLNTPASMVFGSGPFNACSMYVTSLIGPEVVEVFVGTRGRTLIR